MKCFYKILCLSLFLFSCGVVSQASPRPGQPKSFVDFVFGRINPENIDYGNRVEHWRQDMLNATVRDYGFWADVFAMAMLGTAFILIYWQHRQNQNVRFHTARLLCAYHSELAEARTHGGQLQTEYEHLKRASVQQSEEALMTKQAASKRENSGAQSAGSLTQLLQNSPSQSAGEKQLRDEVDRLKQQLDQLNGTNGKLRGQITTLTQKLEQEQQKNRKLRGE